MKPPPQTKNQPETAPFVEVMRLEAMDAEFPITSQGTVRPQTETVLSAEISGAIVGLVVRASGEESQTSGQC